MRANAIAEGILLGEQRGEALALQRLLNKRLGPLPAEVAAQISAAGPEQIEAWLDLVLDAADLAAIFPPKQH
ncbi:DUF4351 domain-containing protein [Propionivibrio sp.]|uniref:DUF4351 domain-containing protein n=1 Tax=Propionivibrio sp. TaxID=2212460 RepID=UPI003BF18858